ncbi:hypothetical protein MPSEU_001031700 [Mayamaea pseudoterrestris]|nr:hypothetical protein MPSEU_001031700 [Mayamaea pseudoterrestris]
MKRLVPLILCIFCVNSLSVHRLNTSNAAAVYTKNKATTNAKLETIVRPVNKTGEQSLKGRQVKDIDLRTFKLSSPDLRSQLKYVRNGHAVLRNVLPKVALNAISAHLKEHAIANRIQAYQQKVAVMYNDSQLAESLKTIADCRSHLDRKGIHTLPFLQYFHTWRSIPIVLDLAYSLAPVAATLMDCSSVRLYQDSLFYKSASDDAHGPTPWHVDARMAPFDTSHMITFWIPLHDIASGESGLVFCSKSHADFALPFWSPYNDKEKGAKKASAWHNLEERYKHQVVDYLPLELGDVTVHSGWTLHCADGCDRAAERWALAISFVDAQAPVRAGNDAVDKGDNEDMWSYREWLRTVQTQRAGRSLYQLWHHPLVPVLWPPSQQTKLKRE